jgi:hypothetical protein
MIWILSLLVFAPALWAQEASKDKPKSDEPPTPAEQYKALMGEFQKAQQQIVKEYTSATTDEEKEKALEAYKKKPAEFTARFLDFAQKNAKEKQAIDALTFVVSNTQNGAEGNKAVALLLENYGDKLGSLLPRLVQASSPAAERLLRAVCEKGSDAKIQGQACLNLAQHLKHRTELPELKSTQVESISKEAERLFTKVVDLAEVGTLAEQAKKDLKDLQTFGIGKQPPDIEGEDIDGQKFKLSDYRGKVVVLDFWGNW